MTLTHDQIDKIGNTLIYLREKIGFLSKTKAIKLLYLIEEKAVEKFGYQVLNLDFEIWKHGPVDRQMYVELTNGEPGLLSSYIRLEDFDEDKKKIEPIVEFNDDEFSDADLELIDEVIATYGGKSAAELVDITHREGSLWHNKAKKHGWIFWQFNSSTKEKIDFTELIKEDQRKTVIFSEHKEHQKMKSSLRK